MAMQQKSPAVSFFACEDKIPIGLPVFLDKKNQFVESPVDKGGKQDEGRGYITVYGGFLPVNIPHKETLLNPVSLRFPFGSTHVTSGCRYYPLNSEA